MSSVYISFLIRNFIRISNFSFGLHFLFYKKYYYIYQSLSHRNAFFRIILYTALLNEHNHNNYCQIRYIKKLNGWLVKNSVSYRSSSEYVVFNIKIFLITPSSCVIHRERHFIHVFFFVAAAIIIIITV